MNQREPVSQSPLRSDLSGQDGNPPSDEIIRRLMEANFSAESSLRKPLRDRLEQRMQARQPSSWLQKMGISLTALAGTTPLKVGLLVSVLLAQVLIAPAPTPVIADLTQPVSFVVANTNDYHLSATIESDPLISSHPIPVPTPGIGVRINSPIHEYSSQPKSVSIEPTGFQANAGTPKPTPLAPITSLP